MSNCYQCNASCLQYSAVMQGGGVDIDSFLHHTSVSKIARKMENQNEQQPLRIPQLYPIPPLDGIEELIEEAQKRGVTRSFGAWGNLISNKLASLSEDNFPANFFTISDQTWSNHIASGKNVPDLVVSTM